MPKKPFDPCKVNACKIQSCLSENKYQEDKCLEVLEDMRQCCIKWKSVSLCCDGIDLEKNPKLTKKESQEKEQKEK